MDRTERFYKIHQLLTRKQVVRVDEFREALGISLATFKRDLEYLRDRLNAPIEWDRARGGYRYVAPSPDAPRYELPGVWFNASEIRALLTLQHLLANLQPGLLEPHVKPLLARLRALLGGAEHPAEEIERRIRIIHLGARAVRLPHFEEVASALLRRQRLRIVYRGRGSGELTEREVSPQRLVHYRENWYLDAWCHLREGLRSFAVDAIERVAVLDQRAETVPDAELDEVLASGYGIFSGPVAAWATLRFSAARARWVATEQWHPQQKGRFEEDGSYVLEVPYSDPRELIMDVLRHGPEVEFLAPEALRQAVRQQLEVALARYRS
ncbi:MAG: YafY family transcriptional regulator [Burkholderiales bacterium]|nr:YafY family transcriptional regulator [Burkholderiales bacterium]